MRCSRFWTTPSARPRWVRRSRACGARVFARRGGATLGRRVSRTRGWHSMSPRHLPGWLIAACLMCLFALMTSGFDVSEGVEHADWARSISTGEVGLTSSMSPNWIESRNGRFYSAHEAGNAFALVPFVWTAHTLGIWSSGILGRPDLAAVVEGAVLPTRRGPLRGAHLSCLLPAVSGSPRGHQPTAVLAAAALGTTTILFPYSRMLFDGVLGGMLIAWSLVWADRASAKTDWRCAAFAGLAIGGALATRQTLAVFALPAVAMLMWAAPPQRFRLVAAFGTALLPRTRVAGVVQHRAHRGVLFACRHAAAVPESERRWQHRRRFAGPARQPWQVPVCLLAAAAVVVRRLPSFYENDECSR